MINAAIVGLGWWGRTLVESAEGSDLIRFVAGTTRRMTGEVEAFAKQKDFRLAQNYEALLGDRAIDAVVLATPHSLHAAQVIAAADARKHIYCEKPFTQNVQQAEQAIAAVGKAGVTLAVGYNRRFHPEMGRLRDMIRADELGVILHVEATLTNPNVLSIDPKHWRANKAETPLGGLTPMGVHAIDAMVDLCGPIDDVFAQSLCRVAPVDLDDTTTVLLRMADGMSGYLGTMTTTGPSFVFTVYGSKGWVRLEGVTHVVGASSDERRKRLFGPCRFQPVKGEPRVWEAERLDSTRAALEAFAKAASGGPPYPIPYEQVIHVVAATDAIIRSAASADLERVA